MPPTHARRRLSVQDFQPSQSHSEDQEKSDDQANKNLSHAEIRKQFGTIGQRQERAKKKAGDPVAPGTELYVARSLGPFTYHHAGVYVGDGRVVHVFAEPKQAVKSLLKGEPIVTVQDTHVDKFAEGDTVEAGPTKTAYQNEIAMANAEHQTGQGWDYDPLNNNCQHFSSESVSGSRRSPEAEAIKDAFKWALSLPGRGIKAVGRGVKAVGTGIAKASRSVGGWLGKVKRKMASAFASE